MSFLIRLVKPLLAVFLIFLSFNMLAQNVPLETPVAIDIISFDSTALDYYNIYAVEYRKDGLRGETEIMVPKNDDALKYSTGTKEVRLCRVKEILQPVNNGKTVIPLKCMVDNIVLTNKYKEQIMLLFDPSVQGAVLQLCP